MVDKKALGIIEGRIVHFVTVKGPHRPALIVNALRDTGYTEGEVNLLVFGDGMNDDNTAPAGVGKWETSVMMCEPTISEAEGSVAPMRTWHFPER